MRNIARINNYYNNIESWNDWRRISENARGLGFGHLVEKNKPPDDAKWRTVDKCIAALREDCRTALKTAVQLEEMTATEMLETMANFL